MLATGPPQTAQSGALGVPRVSVRAADLRNGRELGRSGVLRGVVHQRLAAFQRGPYNGPQGTLGRCLAGQGRSLETSTSQQTLFERLASGSQRKYVMITGKGGVGKTSLASSLALRLASEGHTTLVVSTDPAHSLSDSLAQNVCGGVPVMVEGTAAPLWALEIDPERESKVFKSYTAGAGRKEVEDVIGGFGMGALARQLGDLDLGDLLSTTPPGFDEAIAIAKVQQFVSSEEFAKFSRIVFDTAPTGHTLRLLSAPEFADAALGKLIRLRERLAAGPTALRTLFGLSSRQEDAMGVLERLQRSVRTVHDLLHDPDRMELVVATIPTMLAINESSRLVGALRREGVPCRAAVVNQLVGREGAVAAENHLRATIADQARALKALTSGAATREMRLLRAPYSDLEIRGVPALSYFGGQLWDGHLAELAGPGAGRRFYMLGGKGGVGKTSCSASLGLALAREGHRVLVVSTDPAHSLSDAVDQDVSGGSPVEVVGSEGNFFAMELDLEKEGRELVRALRSEGDSEQARAGSPGRFAPVLNNLGLGGLLEQLKALDLGQLLDTPPPGMDEALAIAKVVQLLDSEAYRHYSHIVFDTAPTGHTLRLLSLPDFLDTGIGKILLLKQRMAAMGETIKGLFTGKQASPKSKLELFQERLTAAKRLFHDERRMQFIAVTIPTMMAVSETERLVTALRKEGIPLHTIVVNQVIALAASASFLENRRRDQTRALRALAADPQLGRLEIVTAPLFDLEVRGIPALDYFGKRVWLSSGDRTAAVP